ncbi:MAG: hypothetical protein V1729_03370, partial [Candidatus Woesearchaeota archaeon]
KIDTLIDQNQKIAKGIVAIADMVKEKLEEMNHNSQVLVQSPPPRSLPPLSGGPGPGPMSGAPQGSQWGGPPPGPAGPWGAPQGNDAWGAYPGQGSPLPPPEGMDSPGTGLPPLTPPGVPPGGPGDRRTILGGLMR